jgi:hypothetical protein
MKRVLLTLLCWLTTVVLAQAQSTPAPTFEVGDSWRLSDGREIKVIRVDDAGMARTGDVRDCPACVVHFDKQFGFSGTISDGNGKPVDVTRVQGAFVGPNWKFYDFPLETGKSWSFSAQGFFRGQPQRYDVTITVKSHEDVKTKAGTFKAYRLQQDWRSRNQFGADFTWSNTVWYAPEVKGTVKFASTNINAREWELLSYSVK